MGPSGHPDDPDDPQQRDHQEPEDLSLQTLQQPVVPPHPARPAFGPRLVHVPDQHRSHGSEIRIPGGHRYYLRSTVYNILPVLWTRKCLILANKCSFFI